MASQFTAKNQIGEACSHETQMNTHTLESQPTISSTRTLENGSIIELPVVGVKVVIDLVQWSTEVKDHLNRRPGRNELPFEILTYDSNDSINVILRAWSLSRSKDTPTVHGTDTSQSLRRSKHAIADCLLLFKSRATLSTSPLLRQILFQKRRWTGNRS